MKEKSSKKRNSSSKNSKRSLTKKSNHFYTYGLRFSSIISKGNLLSFRKLENAQLRRKIMINNMNATSKTSDVGLNASTISISMVVAQIDIWSNRTLKNIQVSLKSLNSIILN